MRATRSTQLRALATLVVAMVVSPAVVLAQDMLGASDVERPATERADLLAPTEVVANEALDVSHDIGDIEIDGRLDEPDWLTAAVFTGFTAKEPVEGEPAVEDTEVRVLFGDEAMWIAARMWDSEPSTITDRLARRDTDGQFDKLSIHIDPNHDRLTGYIFSVSAANVQTDRYLYNDDKLDLAWDAVWISAVRKDDLGWTAEIRIPLSQIRYEASPEPQTWGINFYRKRVASNEESYYSLVSRARKGIASQMGRMEGVVVDRPSRRLEVLPYVVSNFHNGPSTPGDPFFDGSSANSRMGVDVSYGLGAAFTLDATINPDFGQVEADPAVINLTVFETFQAERRPFFVEDARVFDFSLSGARNALFYSRRIGRAPHGGSPSDAEYSEIPTNATILGAVKLAGRTSGGLSIGALGAVTGTEFGEGIFEDGSPGRFLVEPRTQFGVLSLGQDFNEGTTRISGIATGMNRELPVDGAYDWLPSTAFNGGVRFETQWANRTYAMFAYVTGSHVRGSEEAITRVQRASNHYFQRPDATRLAVDESATAISGMVWRLNLEKRGGEHWTGGLWSSQVTPGFEVNDIGFYTTAERLDAGARINYKEIRPGSIFRNYHFGMITYHNWSHEVLDDVWSFDSWRNSRLRGVMTLNANGQLLNYWSVRTSGTYTPQAMSRSVTRGGPMMITPAKTKGTVTLSSDRRKLVSFSSHFEMEADGLDDGGSWTVRGDVKVQPSDNMSVTVSPRYKEDRSGHQYVTATRTLPYSLTYGTRYLFADLERRTFSMKTRIDWTFTPKLSLQLFAQPLLSAGDYQQYKQLAASQTYLFREFVPGTGTVTEDGVSCSGSICDVDGRQYVDFDYDGEADYSFTDRDFNIRSLIGNAVIRWEYRPGSTLFLVWQRQQSDRAFMGDFDFGRDASALLEAPADNRFIIKMNYWLGL
jgi:hypothetical protein